MLVEEVHVFGAALKHIPKDAFEKRFGQVHVVGQIVKRHFRFDHPEFGEVSRRVRVLCSKRGSERVHFAQRTGENLCVQLSADGEVGRAVEEIGREVDGSIGHGHMAGSIVVTRNISPAPSQSLAVMIGV